MVQGGPVDVVTGDYLAEVTMLVLAKSRLRRPGGGYAASFLRQIEPVLGEIADRRIKVVVNAGGLDPGPMADAIRDLLTSHGLALSVAHVEGDDILPRLRELTAGGALTHLSTGAAFSTWGHEPLTANAYFGGFGIKAALCEGADIVITGRVADASLAVGAAAWWWDWRPGDLDALAGAVVAGHVIECGAQATGGNYSGFKTVADLDRPGFPIAEIAADGSAIITKHPATAGAVTVATVTAQLLYEIGSPAYLNPDVVAELSTVFLAQEGEDRVSLRGTRGQPPPATTKVAVTALGGWQNSCTAVITGLDVEEKATLLERSLRKALEPSTGIEDLRFTRIGSPVPDSDAQMLASCLLHIAVQGDEAWAGRAFSAAVVELALANYPGIYFTGPPSNGAAYGVYWPGLVRQDGLQHDVVLADGRRISVPVPGSSGGQPTDVPAFPRSGDGERRRNEDEPAKLPEPTAVVPLGLVLDARSGDKGGDANLGVWVREDDAFSWLRGALTVEVLRALLPEIAGLDVDRYELANLRAVNFVIHDLLDGGATEARRYDKQAKALGEWLRSRHFEVPSRLLAGDVTGSA
jgi:hypothetical protein